ncbi:GpE family phage tail protein [Novosphingobium umbonatum]|uniref:GpE family phage tail protein n=1 Tax=Novosphingobium umbonatum TaxID=1908524 RepID=A0A3S2UQ20_9SPHN|nr:GpE family phage tail protein [Novosphingobium umbonatum]
MADLGFFNGWQPSELEAMPIGKLMLYRELAVKRWNSTFGAKED